MRWKKRVAGVTVAALVCLGLTGGQTQAVEPPGNEWFAPCDPGAGEAQARGGPAREPHLGQEHKDLPVAAKGKAGRDFKATVPVYFHVVTDGSTGALTKAQISAQITVLNKTFAGAEGGDDTGFSFRLAGVTRTDNAAWFYAGPGGTNEHSMKRSLHTGGPGDLNLYSTTAGAGLLGWAYLPDIVTKPGQAYLDGVVVDWESFLGTSTRYAGAFDQGETTTHEVGHWLNLEHTFYGGCSAHGDFVEDTPAQKTPSSGCPVGKDTCKAPGLDPIHNYMDYSFDSCYTQFTPGQSQRMADSWLLYRA
ncbi:zinc metalloprotease [Kribbella turkmenica]|uniref:Zinc metalloprotease n=1 Tax=Kribbella turkmenica TaxID=2530375 RepID=A0A4R4XHK5_9ACTN|nr:zinc metalloprotease [Kribbella turkmenica]TDD30451.1 zinc metalloprotease [Kribbella turkmenica]